jgi:hypothetical protein
MLGELVITWARKTGPEFAPADLAVEDMVGSNPKGFGGKLFLGVVYEVEDETIFVSVTASAKKVRPEDHKGCVFNIQTADLILELDYVPPLIIHTETLVKKEKEFAVNDRGPLVEPRSFLVHVHHTWWRFWIFLASAWFVDHGSLFTGCCPNHPREDVDSFLRLSQAVRGIFFEVRSNLILPLGGNWYQSC